MPASEHICSVFQRQGNALYLVTQFKVFQSNIMEINMVLYTLDLSKYLDVRPGLILFLPLYSCSAGKIGYCHQVVTVNSYPWKKVYFFFFFVVEVYQISSVFCLIDKG